MQGAWFVALCVALPVGAIVDGIRGIAIAHAVVGVCLVIPLYTWFVRRTGIRISRVVGPMGRPVVGVVLLTTVVLLLRALSGPPLLQLLLGGTVGAVVYLAVVWPLRKELAFGQKRTQWT